MTSFILLLMGLWLGPFDSVEHDPWMFVRQVSMQASWENVGQPVYVLEPCATCPSGWRQNGQTAQLQRCRQNQTLRHEYHDTAGNLMGWRSYGFVGDKPVWTEAKP